MGRTAWANGSVGRSIHRIKLAGDLSWVFAMNLRVTLLYLIIVCTNVFGLVSSVYLMRLRGPLNKRRLDWNRVLQFKDDIANGFNYPDQT